MKKYLYIGISIIFCSIFLSGCAIPGMMSDSAEITTCSRVNSELEITIQNIINHNIKNTMSEYDIAKFAHDYIVSNTNYDNSDEDSDNISDESYSAYGALVKHTAVCQGYAEAYMLLTTAAGLECKIISGQANGTNHAWNIVKVDNKWYNVDVTWDDPTGSDRTDSNNLSYKYFLIPDSIMYQDHTPDGKTVSCSSDKFLYGPKAKDDICITIDTPYSIPNYYLNAYLQGHTKVTFYFPTPMKSLDTQILSDTAEKLQKINKKLINAVYTPVSQIGDYYYTTITFTE